MLRLSEQIDIDAVFRAVAVEPELANFLKELGFV